MPVDILEDAPLNPVWQPIETARKNGELLLLIVDYHGEGDHPLEDARYARTIGFNNFDNDGEDEWHFSGWCWTHDHFVEGKGRPVRWAILPPIERAPLPKAELSIS